MTEARLINLALQGGGAHGAVTWGVLDRLLEDERIGIDSVSGTSAGAVNAAALAYGLHVGGRDGARQTLGRLWEEISSAGALYSPLKRTPIEVAIGVESSLSYRTFDYLTRAFSPYQFNPFDFNPLKDVLERVIDFSALRACKAHQLFLTATNVRTGKVKVFEARDATIDAVLAAACLPTLFKAVEIDGEHYWDGGYVGNPALFPFFYRSHAQDIVIVHVNPLEREEIPKSTDEIVNRINEISFNSSLLSELRAIGFVKKLLEDGWIRDEYRDRLKNIRIHSIRSDEALEKFSVASKFNVELGFLQGLKERGRAIADAWLKKNYWRIGETSSVDIRALYDGSA
jgi:NTE family protein